MTTEETDFKVSESAFTEGKVNCEYLASKFERLIEECDRLGNNAEAHFFLYQRITDLIKILKTMSIAHTPSEQLDKYIKEVGKGSTRDALNVALFENSQMREILEKIAYPRRGTEEEYWDLEQIGLICDATLKTLGKTF